MTATNLPTDRRGALVELRQRVVELETAAQGLPADSAVHEAEAYVRNRLHEARFWLDYLLFRGLDQALLDEELPSVRTPGAR